MSSQFKRVLVTGGSGYVGSLLIPQLLDEGYEVLCFDVMYFGHHFLPQDNPNLSIIKGDIRDTGAFKEACQGVDAIIHLACISNDASFELDENLSTTVNYDAFEPMVSAAKEQGVKRFIYASSSSVYGVSKEKDVTEEHPLVPLTLYNKFKGMCEPLLFHHMDESFECVVVRPATICGYAPRMRLDLSVNILTNHAITQNKITVFGGEQLRPNLHIKDMCDCYSLLLTASTESIQGQIFNVGYQNLSIEEIANMVSKIVWEEFPDKNEILIEKTHSDDLRSYHINSEKITKILGFEPKRTIEDAVRDLCTAFKDGKIEDPMTNHWYYNVRQLKSLAAV